MSKTKMVTIEVPIEVAASFSTLEDVTGHIGPLAQACKAALAARKTKLEVWRDGLPEFDGAFHSVTGGMYSLTTHDVKITGGRVSAASDVPRLIRAAPQMAATLAWLAMRLTHREGRALMDEIGGYKAI